MRSTFKVLFYVNGSKEKNGIVPIMGREYHSLILRTLQRRISQYWVVLLV